MSAGTVFPLLAAWRGKGGEVGVRVLWVTVEYLVPFSLVQSPALAVSLPCHSAKVGGWEVGPGSCGCQPSSCSHGREGQLKNKITLLPGAHPNRLLAQLDSVRDGRMECPLGSGYANRVGSLLLPCCLDEREGGGARGHVGTAEGAGGTCGKFEENLQKIAVLKEMICQQQFVVTMGGPQAQFRHRTPPPSPTGPHRAVV